MKTFLLYILAFVATVCVAQPQAPVVWGEARWLGYPASYTSPFDSAVVYSSAPVMMGDTLVYSRTRGGITARR